MKEIDQAASTLADARAAWVLRRDAADALGQAAEQAIRVLQQHRKDKDADVRPAAERALGRASAALAGMPPLRGYSLEELAQACAKADQRIVEPDGEGFVVTIETANGRKQRVTLQPREGRRGKLIVLTTRCGKATPDSIAWALRANTDLALGALALVKEDDEEWLVLRSCHLPGETTPLEIKAAVKELAHYGDWIERKLSGAEDLE
ncbi:MAG: hypothetical protein RBU21_07880 [FCB group bacterium]|nr:hypothetical protein [FCB group bacterium]